jgi:hypothetical protein
MIRYEIAQFSSSLALGSAGDKLRSSRHRSDGRGSCAPDLSICRRRWPPRYQIAGTRQTPAGVVVLYGEELPHSDGSHNLGYAFVERRSWRWDVRSGRSGNMTPDAASRAIYLVGELNAGERPDDPAPTIVFGQVLDPTMVAVAVEPAAGEIVEDVVTNGMFAVVFPPLIAPCTIRFLDTSGGLVQEADIAISPPAGLPSEWLQRIQDQCQQQR